MKTTLLIVTLTALGAIAAYAGDDGNPLDTYNGQPVGTNLSPDDANGYVDITVQHWLAAQPPNLNVRVMPQDMLRLAAAVQRLGIPNLASVYDHTALDKVDVSGGGALVPQDQIKRDVVEKALSLSAGTSDIPALLNIYDQRPLILQVFVDHPEWDSDSRLADFLSAQLSQINDAYQKSDLAPINLLLLAARSPSPVVQGKLDSLITDATTHDDAYKNAHFYVALLDVYRFAKTSPISKHLGDILIVLGHRAKTQVLVNIDDTYTDVSCAQVFYPLVWSNPFVTHPEAFADDRVRAAILKLADAAEESGYKSETPLICAAACGSKPSLVKLAEFCRGDNAIAPNVSTDRNNVKSYLETIRDASDGNNVETIAMHINDASYDPNRCRWTISKDGGNAEISAPGTPAIPSPQSSLTSTASAPVAPQIPTGETSQPSSNPSATATPANAAIPAIITATVIKSTTISSTTPSGGHASIPLEIGTRLIVVSINGDGTLTAKTEYQFQGTLPLASVAIQK